MNEELLWDNGTPFPEPCIDRIADTVGKVSVFSLILFSYGSFALILMHSIDFSFSFYLFIYFELSMKHWPGCVGD